MDEALWAISGLLFCGVDEAGAGPLAGPLVAAAAILPVGYSHPTLRDSKQLSESQRERIHAELSEDPEVSYVVVEAPASEIISTGIRPANLRAMRDAALGVLPQGGVVLTDARDLNLSPAKYRTFPLIKGDRRSLSVAAASIFAKVHRDRVMVELDALYPGYGFAVHKGYPTKAHREAIRRLGPSPVHRTNFNLGASSAQ